MSDLRALAEAALPVWERVPGDPPLADPLALYKLNAAMHPRAVLAVLDRIAELEATPRVPAVSVKVATYEAVKARAARQGTTISDTLDRLIVGALAAKP